jgi:hypothetical protein
MFFWKKVTTSSNCAPGSITWEKKSNCDVDVANVSCYQYLHQLPISFQTNEEKQAYLATKIREIRECEQLSNQSPEDLWRRDLEKLLVILNEAEVAEQENLALIAETTLLKVGESTPLLMSKKPLLHQLLALMTETRHQHMVSIREQRKTNYPKKSHCSTNSKAYNVFDEEEISPGFRLGYKPKWKKIRCSATC